jgi:hypothetical protein
MPVWVNISQWIIAHITILIESLRIPNVGVWQRSRLADLFAGNWINDSALKLIRTKESALGSAVVPGEEVIQSRFGIPFFAGRISQG